MQNQPLYEKCKLSIIDYAVRMALRRGAALPPQRTLCAMTGHSMITVRRAVAELEKEKLLHSVPGKGVFVAGSFASAEAPNGTVVLFDVQKLFRDINNSLYRLQRELLSRGCELRIITRNASEFSIPDSECVAAASRATGILFCGLMNAHWLEFLRSQNKPVVLVGQNNGVLSGMKTVVTDPSGRIPFAVEYLARKNCRRFAFINTMRDYPPAADMGESFINTLKERHLAFSPELLVFIDGARRSELIFQWLDSRRGQYDGLLVQAGLLTDVLTGFWELELPRCPVAVVDDFWGGSYTLNKNIIRIGTPISVFELALEVVFDQLKPRDRQRYPGNPIVQSSGLIAPVTLNPASKAIHNARKEVTK